MFKSNLRDTGYSEPVEVKESIQHKLYKKIQKQKQN